MMHLSQFISDHVTHRSTSQFVSDVETNRERLTAAISCQSVCVIGGAGSIGSSFIRALLPFRPSKLETIFAKSDFTKEEVVKAIQAFIPNFSHEEKGKNLDEKK